MDPQVFAHPLYTPQAEAVTGFLKGADRKPYKLPAPLTWPEHDQTRPSIQELSRITNTDASTLAYPHGGFRYSYPEEAIGSVKLTKGGYPKIPEQYAVLRDPHTYWDVQGRRNYGELLSDHDNFTEVWGIGPEMNTKLPQLAMLKMMVYIVGISGLIYIWGPEGHAYWVSK